MKTQEQIVQELNAKIPRDVVSLRDGGGGRKLSYLEGWYVIDRLNVIFGQGNWSYNSEVTLLRADDLEKESYGKATKYHSVHYMAKVSLYFRIKEDQDCFSPTTNFTDYGYGDGSDAKVPGKAHELAIKEAVTDGLKRCAKNLGMSLGLALYDKTQENVDDGQEQRPTPVAIARVAVPAAAKPAEPISQSTKAPVQATGPSRELVQKSIQEHIKVIVDKKLATTDDMRAKVKEFGADKSVDLTDEQAKKFLEHLKGLLK